MFDPTNYPYHKDLKDSFWVFDLADYYPAGGLSDVVYTTNNLEDAKDCVRKGFNKREVFDSINREVVFKKDSNLL